MLLNKNKYNYYMLLLLLIILIVCVGLTENYSNNWSPSLSWFDECTRYPTPNYTRPYHKYAYPWYGVSKPPKCPERNTLWHNNWTYPRQYYETPDTTRPWNNQWTYAKKIEIVI